ncbi:MAG: DUF2959 family protein [Planctomycetes bacterium]|nr:DUF2959 family protein [Planctomycetota bacterium]
MSKEPAPCGLRSGLAVALSLVAGCAGAPERDSGPQRVDAFVGWVERVHVESELAQERAAAALDALGALVGPDSRADPVLAFGAFVASVEHCEAQADALEKAFGEMQKAAEPVFGRWEADLQVFSSERLRERSRERLDETRGRYAALAGAITPAIGSLDALNRSLRDQALFLSHDLNPSALAALEEEFADLEQTARALDEQLVAGRDAARDYVNVAALPMRAQLGRPSAPQQ